MRSSTRSLAFVLSLTTLGLASGCALRGSGTPASEVREVESFEKIDIGGAFELIVHVQPDAPQKLEITADDNLLEKINASVVGRELDVEFADVSFVRPKTPVRVEVWVPNLTAVKVSGAADVEIEGLRGEAFELDSSGASDTTLRGAVDRLTVDISGAGDIHARELAARIVEIDLSGAGEAEVSASEQLDVDISGAGEVDYWGSPPTVNQKISGAGSLNKRD